MSITASLPAAAPGLPRLAARAGSTGLWLAALVLLGLGLRLFRLTAPSLWIDEGFSLQVAVADRARFLDLVMADVHPPAYYLALHAWTSVFGGGEFALRSLGVAFGVLTIPLLFSIGRMLGGARVGLVAAGLLATSPLHIHYCTEVRMYALLALAAAATLWGALRFALDPADPAARRQGLAAYVGGATLSVWTQAAGGIVVLPPAALLMLAGWWFAGRPRAAVRPFLLAQAGFAVVLGASLPVFLPLAQNAAGLTAWILPPTPRTVAEVLGAILAPKLAQVLPHAAVAAVAAGIGLLALRGAAAWRRDAARLAFVLLAGGLPFLLTIGISLAAMPVFVLRIHLWALLPLHVLLAAALVALRGTKAGLPAAAFVLLAQGLGLHAYHFEWARPDWRGAVAAIAAGAGPEDWIVTPPLAGVEALVGYYAPGLRDRVLVVARPEDLPGILARTEGRQAWTLTGPWFDTAGPEALARGLAAGHREGRPVALHELAVTRWTPLP